MHVGSLGGTWGVSPDTLGHAKGRPGGFLIDLGSFWGPFLEPFLGTPVGTLQASKQAKRDKEMDLSCQPWRKVDISSRSGRHRVVPELDFTLKVQKIAVF